MQAIYDRRSIMLEKHPSELIRRRRKIAGMSAVLLPMTELGEIDWSSFRGLLERTVRAGLVPAVRVGYLLERCRLPVDAVSVERLLGELGADDDTRVTLAEFVDMAALLMSA